MDARVARGTAGDRRSLGQVTAVTGDAAMGRAPKRSTWNPVRRAMRRAGSWSAALVAVGVALVVIVPASTAVSATSGLVAAYGFEAGSGAIAADTSGNRNNGTIAHGTWTTSGVYGSALRLDGSGPGMVVDDSPSLHLNHAMTLEAWVKPSAVSDAWRDLVYKGDDSYFLEATSPHGGVPAAGGRFPDGDRTETFGTAALSTGAWAYLAATYDGSELRLYVSGEEVSSVRETGPIKSSGKPLEIGGDDVYGQYLDGLVDEVRVYDVALTADEIRSDMTTPVVPRTPGDVEPPSAPGALSATAASSGEIDLRWGQARDNVGVAGYEVFRCGGVSCTDFTRVAQVDGTSSTYADTGVASGSSYSYRVRAIDAAGNIGPFSAPVSVSTPTPGSPDREPPSAPGTLSATAASSGEVDLRWGQASDNVGVAGYEVFRCGGVSCTDFTRVAQVAATSTSYADTSVAASSSYSYRVRAIDAAGNIGPYSNSANVTTPAGPDTDPPSAPGTLSATAASSGEVDLSWGAATDGSAVVYDLERCEGSGCTDFAPLATTTTTDHSDTSVAASSTYVYRVRAIDAAGNIGPYSDSVSVTTPHVGPGPISVAPSGRYLVDQTGAPFLMTGDSPQALIGNLTESDAELYFASRRAEGFNTVWINLLCNSYTGCRGDGATWDGVQPFNTPGDFSTPNEAYFAHVDRILRLAGDYGLVVVLDPAETGGWLGTMVDNGVDKLRAYGRYLGERYKDFPNIIWMHGNDYQTWGPTNDPYVTAVALGISDVDTRHLQTVELDYTTSGSLDDEAWAPIIQLNASYTYFPTYEQVLTDYNRGNFLPVFMVEADYEFEQLNAPPGGTPKQLRRQEYWTLLSGATGQLYGNHYTWQFLCPQRDGSGSCIGGWKNELDTPGQTQFGYVKALFGPRRWYDLVPDQAHAVVTDGLGTYGTNDYVTAASTPDGTLAIAYVPSSRTLTVDLSKFSGSVTARWYDPAAGTFTSIAGSPYTNAGNQQFITPGTNAEGGDDWVLVLEVQ
jgi:fibronectin type 3 domain-containing protein